MICANRLVVKFFIQDVCSMNCVFELDCVLYFLVQMLSVFLSETVNIRLSLLGGFNVETGCNYVQ